LICINRRAKDIIALLADVVLMFHALIALFILGGLVATWVGEAPGWP
jgi:hypothetical protein